MPIKDRGAAVRARRPTYRSSYVKGEIAAKIMEEPTQMKLTHGTESPLACSPLNPGAAGVGDEERDHARPCSGGLGAGGGAAEMTSAGGAMAKRRWRHENCSVVQRARGSTDACRAVSCTAHEVVGARSGDGAKRGAYATAGEVIVVAVVEPLQADRSLAGDEWREAGREGGSQEGQEGEGEREDELSQRWTWWLDKERESAETAAEAVAKAEEEGFTLQRSAHELLWRRRGHDHSGHLPQLTARRPRRTSRT